MVHDSAENRGIIPCLPCSLRVHGFRGCFQGRISFVRICEKTRGRRLEEFSLGFYKLVLAVQTADRSGEERPNFSTNLLEISIDLEAVGLGFLSRRGTLCSPVELSEQ